MGERRTDVGRLAGDRSTAERTVLTVTRSGSRRQAQPAPPVLAWLLLLQPRNDNDPLTTGPFWDGGRQGGRGADRKAKRGAHGKKMRTGSNHALFQYWNAIRGGRPAPRRFEIEPSQIADILPDTFILEVSDPAHFSYRLAGTRVCEIFGQELRGIGFLEGWRETDRFMLNRNLNAVRRSAACAVMEVEGFGSNTDLVRLELVVLPLLHNGSSIERFLGGFVALNARRRQAAGPVADLRIAECDLTYPASERSTAEIAEAGRSQARGLHSVEPPVFRSVRNSKVVRAERRQFRVYEGGLSAPGDAD